MFHLNRCIVQHKPGSRLKLRMGIHSGRVVGGVVGTKIPHYSVFGYRHHSFCDCKVMLVHITLWLFFFKSSCFCHCKINRLFLSQGHGGGGQPDGVHWQMGWNLKRLFFEETNHFCMANDTIHFNKEIFRYVLFGGILGIASICRIFKVIQIQSCKMSQI